jgi:hypothetical protein
LWATVSNYQVRLGRSDDMTEKALSLAALLEERPPEGSMLTLIAPTNPAWKAPSDTDDGGNDTADTTDAADQSGDNSNDDS